LLKPPVAGLIRRIAVRQVSPRCSSPQDHRMPLSTARLSPRTPSPVCAAHRFGQEAPNEVPLLVREITGTNPFAPRRRDPSRNLNGNRSGSVNHSRAPLDRPIYFASYFL
jgi:hypothetical protein